MQISFLFRLEAWQLMLILLVLMIASTAIGLYAGKKRENESKIDATILGSLFALLGLLLAFSFNLATTFYGMRREIIIDEANNIGTAVLRADLYRQADRQLFRNDFQNYIDARIEYYDGTDMKTVLDAQELSAQFQQKLWNRATMLSKDTGYFVASMQMVPALNNMIDITTTRLYGDYVHLPDPIIYLLIFLSCACAFYVGFAVTKNEKINWPLIFGFYLLTSLVVFVIFDLDRPRRGLIRLDKMNNAIVDLKKMFPEK